MPPAQPAAKYIISRTLDPIFALFIGFSAALMRIRREESEKRSGLPSASMVISPEQQARIDGERERNRAAYAKRKGGKEGEEMYREGDGGSSEDLAKGNRGSGEEEGFKRVEVSYADVLRLGWERVKWKADYVWNERGKEVERKDGRMV